VQIYIGDWYKAMIVVSFETKKDRKTVLEIATKYFVDTVGLKLTEQNASCLTFVDEKNQLGYVKLTLQQKEPKLEVIVEAREYGYQAEEFGRKLK
jgi:hypothetical protein